MADKKQLSQEKQIRAPHITMAIPLAALFLVTIYLGYLKVTGVEISEWFTVNVVIVVNIVTFPIYLALSEVLVKVYGGQFKFKRLVFRCVLTTSYFALIYGVSLFLSVLFPWATTFWQFLAGTLMATAIFLTIVLKARSLFGRLDQGNW
jgi:hypothetical protein